MDRIEIERVDDVRMTPADTLELEIGLDPYGHPIRLVITVSSPTLVTAVAYRDKDPITSEGQVKH